VCVLRVYAVKVRWNSLYEYVDISSYDGATIF